MKAEYQLGIHLQMTVELVATTWGLVSHPSGPSVCVCVCVFLLQPRMSVRMDSSSATTKGVYRPSGGATTMTTAQTTVMKKTVVSETSVEEDMQTMAGNCVGKITQ